MADIRPFHGAHYNQSMVKDLTKVLCPPYDIITPQMQQELYKGSEYNFVRIEFGRELPQDKDMDNRYIRAANTLEKWLEQGILTVDATPSLYIDDHRFTYRSKAYRRRSLNCLVRLENWDKKIIRPHEGTLSKARGDRLNLLWALQANTSPIMALYEDGDRRISPLLEAAIHGKPLLNAGTGHSDSHQLWAITNGEVIGRIGECLADHPLYIADGHHRYESALAYQRERRACAEPSSGSEPYDFVMMTLVDFTDPGLVILPAHRLVRGLLPSALDRLPSRLKTCFIVEEIPLNEEDAGQQIDSLLFEESGGVKLILYGLTEGSLLLLTLRDFSTVSPMIPYFHSEIYHKLDVSIVDHVILEELLGLTHDMTGAFLEYTSDTMDAIKRVDEREYQLACIVNQVRPGIVKAIADSGDRMPRKSTYFYPKIPAGLVFYRFG